MAGAATTLRWPRRMRGECDPPLHYYPCYTNGRPGTDRCYYCCHLLVGPVRRDAILSMSEAERQAALQALPRHTIEGERGGQAPTCFPLPPVQLVHAGAMSSAPCKGASIC